MYKIFKYGKNSNNYSNGAKLHKKVVNKALPIVEVIYPGYSLLFLFNNVTSYLICAKDAFQVKQINKI